MIDTVEQWQELCLGALGRRLVYAADEYYLLAGRPFPTADAYDGFPQHENGIGMARAFEAAFDGDVAAAHGVQPGFFPGSTAHRPRATAPRATDAAPRRRPPRPAAGRRAPRSPSSPASTARGARALAGRLAGAAPTSGWSRSHNALLRRQHRRHRAADRRRHRPRPAPTQPAGHRYLLPDVCLSEGRFLDGMTVAELPRPVEVVPSDGYSLRLALGGAGAASPTSRRARPVPVALGASR